MCRKFVFPIVFIICLYVSELSASTVTLDTEKVQESIVFIYSASANQDQPDKERPIGTGFLIGVPVKSGSAAMYLLLITARHIVEPSWAHCTAPNPQRIFIRVNNKRYDPESGSEGVTYIAVDLLQSNQQFFYTSSNEQVDAAVIPLNLSKYPQKDYDYLPAMVSLFASDEEIKKLGIGDSVASAGLVPGLQGKNRNYAFFKFGYISSVFGEPFPVACEPGAAPRLERVWFIGLNLIPGNSGSPIIYFPPIGFGGNYPSRAIIVGVQSSSILIADLAAMTPVQRIFEIIQSMNLADADLYRGDIAQKPK